MTKKRRTYKPRIVSGQLMMPADLKRLHKYMLDVEHISIVSDEMREVGRRAVARAGAQAAAEEAARMIKECPLSADMPRGSEVFRSDANDHSVIAGGNFAVMRNGPMWYP